MEELSYGCIIWVGKLGMMWGKWWNWKLGFLICNLGKMVSNGLKWVTKWDGNFVVLLELGEM